MDPQQVSPVELDNLLRRLQGEDGVQRQQARQRLVEIDDEQVVAALIPLLQHRAQIVRWEAAKALSQMAHPSSAGALVHALEDDDAEVRWLAAEGISAMRADGLRAILPVLIDRWDTTAIREGAHHVLFRLSKGDLKHIARPVLEALDSLDPSVGGPTAAHEALVKLREEGL